MMASAWRPLPLKVPAVGLQCRTLGKREAFEAGSGDENENESPVTACDKVYSRLVLKPREINYNGKEM